MMKLTTGFNNLLSLALYYVSYTKYVAPYWRYFVRIKFYHLLYPDLLTHLQKSDVSPVFIVGAGRSGNTLLARLLHETGGVHFGPENFSLWMTYLAYVRNVRRPWVERVDIVLNILSGQVDAWRWEKIDLNALRRELDASNEHTLGNIIDAWYRHYGKAIGYPSSRWGCKTPNLTPFIHLFRSVFPKMEVIHIIRQPGEVIASFGKANIVPYHHPTMAAVHWDYYNRPLLYDRNRHLVDYSELVINPELIVARIRGFLSIEGGFAKIQFVNPDLSYEHLSNVNSEVSRKSVNGESSGWPRLSRKYCRYVQARLKEELGA